MDQNGGSGADEAGAKFGNGGTSTHARLRKVVTALQPSRTTPLSHALDHNTHNQIKIPNSRMLCERTSCASSTLRLT